MQAQTQLVGEPGDVPEHPGVQGVRRVRRDPHRLPGAGQQGGEPFPPRRGPALVGVAEHLQVRQAAEAGVPQRAHGLEVSDDVGGRGGPIPQRLPGAVPGTGRPVDRGAEVDLVEGRGPLLQGGVALPAHLGHVRVLQVRVGVDQTGDHHPVPAGLLLPCHSAMISLRGPVAMTRPCRTTRAPSRMKGALTGRISGAEWITASTPLRTGRGSWSRSSPRRAPRSRPGPGSPYGRRRVRASRCGAWRRSRAGPWR